MVCVIICSLIELNRLFIRSSHFIIVVLRINFLIASILFFRISCRQHVLPRQYTVKSRLSIEIKHIQLIFCWLLSFARRISTPVTWVQEIWLLMRKHRIIRVLTLGGGVDDSHWNMFTVSHCYVPRRPCISDILSFGTQDNYLVGLLLMRI